MRTHHRFATTALVAALLAAGCSGGDDASGGGTASEATTSSPSGGSGTESGAGATGDSGTLEDGSGASSTTDGSDGTDGTDPATSTSPSGAVATGTLAAGFPTDVIPLLPGSTITVSTVTPAEGFRTVSLSGTTPQPAEEVLAFYRASLLGQGFVETAGAQVAGFPSATFSRASGADLLVFAVSTLDGVQTFTLGGALAG